MDNKGITRNLKVINQYGIHARPAALIVKEAAKYECDIYVEKDDNKVSCKSIMGLMAIEGYPGAELTITAIGKDANEALDAIESLFINQFNED